MLNETIADPQKGSIKIDSFVNCGLIIGNNIFNSFLLFPQHPSGRVSIIFLGFSGLIFF